MKLPTKTHLLLWSILLFVLGIFLGVHAINDTWSWYRLDPSVTLPVTPNGSSCMVVTSYSSKSLFVPTATSAERNAFGVYAYNTNNAYISYDSPPDCWPVADGTAGSDYCSPWSTAELVHWCTVGGGGREVRNCISPCGNSQACMASTNCQW